MVLIYGWGKKGKPICEAGIGGCLNCKNTTGFVVVELNNQVELYFIPVAKWNKKIFLICEICEAAYPATSEEKELFLRRSSVFPDNAEMVKTINMLQELYSQNLDSKDIDKVNQFQNLAYLFLENDLFQPTMVAHYLYWEFIKHLDRQSEYRIEHLFGSRHEGLFLLSDFLLLSAQRLSEDNKEPMHYCTKCKQEYVESMQHCPNCGHDPTSDETNMEKVKKILGG